MGGCSAALSASIDPESLDEARDPQPVDFLDDER